MTKVLLVDDDELVRYALRSALEIADFDVVEAPDGRVIRDQNVMQDIDAVITDILMPEVEGIELITTLKSVSPEIPIVAMSGGGRLNSTDYLITAQDLGAAAVFEKPFDEVALVDKVRELTSSVH